MLMLAMALQAGTGALAISERLTAVRHCGDGADVGDVIVCGRSPDRNRLPLPTERDTAADVHTPGEPGSALAAITPSAPCGIFAGQRRCGRAEAAGYGYGGGRDPITVVTKLGSKLLHADAELPK